MADARAGKGTWSLENGYDLRILYCFLEKSKGEYLLLPIGLVFFDYEGWGH